MQPDGQTDMTNLVVTFRNFANAALKKNSLQIIKRRENTFFLNSKVLKTNLNAKLSKHIHFLIRFNELCSVYGQQGEAKSDVASHRIACRCCTRRAFLIIWSNSGACNSLIESWPALVDLPLPGDRQLAPSKPWIRHPFQFCNKTYAAVNSHKYLCSVQVHSCVLFRFIPLLFRPRALLFKFLHRL